MRFPSFLLLVLLLGWAAVPTAVGEDEMEGEGERSLLQLGPATVLASPGSPRALDSFLPGGKHPARLTWPLPKGPLLVLGLPHEDPVAQRVADVFQIDTDDLAGGYRIAAWRAKTRPLVLVMAADAAALHAARFEFDADAPMEMMAPDMRSLDFKRPNQQAGIAVKRGTRLVAPRYAIRGLLPKGGKQPLGVASTTSVVGARGNRVWLSGRDLDSSGVGPMLAHLREHGVAPVAYHDDVAVFSCERAEYVAEIAAWCAKQRKAHGIRHFALRFTMPGGGQIMTPIEPKAVAGVADALRPGGLEEITVVPFAHSDRLARKWDSRPTFGAIPEAVVAWSGPTQHATGITRAQAEARVKAATAPVVLLDHWAAPFQHPDLPYVPSLPRGRASDLHDVLDGVIVVGRRGTDAMLESLWEPVAEDRFGRALLAEVCPPVTEETATAAAWLKAFAARLEVADKESLGLVPWMAPLMHRAAGGSGDEDALLIPTGTELDALAVVDGDGVRVRMWSDGASLHVAVHVSDAALKARELLLQILLEQPGPPSSPRIVRIAQLTTKGWRADGPRTRGPIYAFPDTGGTHTRTDAGLDATLTIGRFGLGGDAHPGRTFDLGVAWGPENLWPRTAKIGARALIVIGPEKAAATKAEAK